ncbi:MAG TPA: hypothetical protein VFO24_10980 [Usitatibacter sp.]|nr:hypothetical protein [Usitatibacter sp.]
MTVAAEDGVALALDRIAAMPAVLRDAIDRVPADRRATRPASGEFALVEHACHLRDLDREGFMVRARRILSETLPELEPFQGDAVAREGRFCGERITLRRLIAMIDEHDRDHRAQLDALPGFLGAA